MTDMGIADSFSFLISLRAVTVTSLITTVVSNVTGCCAKALTPRNRPKAIKQLLLLERESGECTWLKGCFFLVLSIKLFVDMIFNDL